MLQLSQVTRKSHTAQKRLVWQLSGHDLAQERCAILSQNGENVTPNATESLTI